MFQYYIKIVPTTFARLDGSTFVTNQFSVTRHSKVKFKSNKAKGEKQKEGGGAGGGGIITKIVTKSKKNSNIMRKKEGG